MAKSRYIENPGIMDDISRLPKVVSAIKSKAEAAKTIAQAIAPVNTGDYKRGIEMDVAVNDRGYTMGRVIASDWKSLWIEFGTSKGFPAHAVLRRAVRAVGGKVTNKSRTK